MAGFRKIPLARQRLMYRVAHAIPVWRNYERLFRFAF
jgi:hypothetical protein